MLPSSVRGRRLELKDLFDVELQLLRDRDVSREELRRRDRSIGLAIDAGERARSGDRLERIGLLRDWVRAIQKQAGQESAGERIVGVYHALGWMLVFLGLSSGVGTAATVLAYDGTRPVNVVHFLAIFVGLQLILLVLFALSSTLWRLRDRLPAIEGLYGLLRLAVVALGRLFERRLSAERRSTLKAARGRLAASHGVYGEAERWLLVSLAQRFGLSFNLGALATCLYLVSFSDLAFAWQTTLSWSAEGFHRVLAILAAPWSWAYPEGLPTLDVVRASRYFRLDGTFGQAGAKVELLGQWWRLLVLGLLVYGLLPRLFLAVFSATRTRRALTRLRLDHGEIASLLERLTSPIVHTQAAVPETGPSVAPAPARERPAAAIGRPEQAVTVVIWGDVPIEAADVETLITRRFGWRVAAQQLAGVDDTRHDEAVVQAVAGQGEPTQIVVVVEAFEAPTREARGFLQRLRAAVGKDRPIVVALLDGSGSGQWAGPSKDDERIWRNHVAGLGDPYLRVEALVETP